MGPFAPAIQAEIDKIKALLHILTGTSGPFIPKPFGAPYVPPPPVAQWTPFNVAARPGQSGPVVPSNVPGGVRLLGPYDTSSIQGLVRPATVDASHTRASLYYAGIGEASAGMALRNSNPASPSFKNIVAFHFANPLEMVLSVWTDENTNSSTQFTTALGGAGPFTWGDMVDDGTNITLRFSVDGQPDNFVEIFQVPSIHADERIYFVCPHENAPAPPVVGDHMVSVLASWQEFGT